MGLEWKPYVRQMSGATLGQAPYNGTVQKGSHINNSFT